MYVAVRFQGITDIRMSYVCSCKVSAHRHTYAHMYVAVRFQDHRHTYAHMYVAVRFQGITDIRMRICM